MFAYRQCRIYVSLLLTPLIRCLCWWGWTGNDGYYINEGTLYNRLVADYCTLKCHYTHVFRNLTCAHAQCDIINTRWNTICYKDGKRLVPSDGRRPTPKKKKRQKQKKRKSFRKNVETRNRGDRRFIRKHGDGRRAKRHQPKYKITSKVNRKMVLSRRNKSEYKNKNRKSDKIRTTNTTTSNRKPTYRRDIRRSNGRNMPRYSKGNKRTYRRTKRRFNSRQTDNDGKKKDLPTHKNMVRTYIMPTNDFILNTFATVTRTSIYLPKEPAVFPTYVTFPKPLSSGKISPSFIAKTDDRQSNWTPFFAATPSLKETRIVVTSQFSTPTLDFGLEHRSQPPQKTRTQQTNNKTLSTIQPAATSTITKEMKEDILPHTSTTESSRSLINGRITLPILHRNASAVIDSPTSIIAAKRFVTSIKISASINKPINTVNSPIDTSILHDVTIALSKSYLPYDTFTNNAETLGIENLSKHVNISHKIIPTTNIRYNKRWTPYNQTWTVQIDNSTFLPLFSDMLLRTSQITKSNVSTRSVFDDKMAATEHTTESYTNEATTENITEDFQTTLKPATTKTCLENIRSRKRKIPIFHVTLHKCRNIEDGKLIIDKR